MADEATEYAAPPSLLLNRYRVDGKLGEGGLGTVMRAFDTRLKRTVAIKTLKRDGGGDRERFQQLEERFAREAEAGSRMGNHPHIVGVYDLVIGDDGTQYLILEFVPVGTLADRLKDGPLSVADALRLTADAARGLDAAHEASIVHRDIKPANLFVAADGRVQVGDFGIAQMDDLSGRTHTSIGHPGTPLYMAPEQSQSTGYLRPAADQYSLGLVLFELLTGAAYKRLGAREVAERLAALPSPVAAIVTRMTATAPDDRYPTMPAVLTALAGAAATLTTDPTRPTITAPAAPPGTAPWQSGGAGVPGNLGANTLPLPGAAGRANTPPLPPHSTPPYLSGSLPASPPPPAPVATPARIGRRAAILGAGGVLLAGGVGGALFVTRNGDARPLVTVAPPTTAPGASVAAVVSGATTPPVSSPTATAGSATAPPTPPFAPSPTAASTAMTDAPAAMPTPRPPTPLPPTVGIPTAPTAPPRTAVPQVPPTAMPPTPAAMPPTATGIRPTPVPANPLSTTPVLPPTPPPSLLRPTFVVPTAYPITVTRVQERLNGNLPEGTDVTYADIRTGFSAVGDNDHVLPAAALIDLFVVTEAYQQIEAKMLRADAPVPIPREVVGGTGTLQKRPGGTTTVTELIALITSESDNFATNVLLDRVGGMDRVNATIPTLGLQNTVMRRRLLDTAAQMRGLENTTTAQDMDQFFTSLVRGVIVSPFVSASVINAMGLQTKPEWDYLGKNLQPRPQIVHMPGQIPPANGVPGVLHDVAIIYTGPDDAYVLTFLNQSLAPNATVAAAAAKLSADIYAIVKGR